MFRLKQRVKIVSSQKTDGRFNFGRIVGIKIHQNNNYLGYKTEKEFISRFDGSNCTYHVAYIDCVTKRACVEEFNEKYLEPAGGK